MAVRLTRVEAEVHTGQPMALRSKTNQLWLAVYAVAGILALSSILAQPAPDDPTHGLLYLLCAIAALSVSFTGNLGSVPAAFLIILLGLTDLSLPELLFIGFITTLLQEIRTRRTANFSALFFALAFVSVGIAMAHAAYEFTSRLGFHALFPTPLITSALVLLLNSGLAAMVLKHPNLPVIGLYHQECRKMLPWFVTAAYLAYLIHCTSLQTAVHPGLIALPILFAMDRGYRAWNDGKMRHQKDLKDLYFRAVEALAVAVEAKDQTTHSHLRRVQTYAEAIGRQLGLKEDQLEVLHVAGLLHDIGKLAIPEYILFKPGPLTPEEWAKMRTHPAVGAEIVTRMKCPTEVGAIIKAHHEKWNGTGYPAHLAGEEIPIGARILSAVDCLDALASDRPYRRALTLDEAMAFVSSESGKSYDPKVIAVLEKTYKKLEQGTHPATGGANETAEELPEGPRSLHALARVLGPPQRIDGKGILDPIASAAQESRFLNQLNESLGHSLTADEVVSSVHRCISQMISYDAMAFYVRRSDVIEPVKILGNRAHVFSLDPLPVAQGLSGWVEERRTPMVNADPALELSYKKDTKTADRLQSALAVPFEGRSGVTGVLTLYHQDRDAFNRDHLRILQAANLHVGLAVENALRYHHAEDSSGSDPLTGISNVRYLSAHIERELSRVSRSHSTLAVVVCDLDGFKQVNDRFGHSKGNEVLKALADGLREVCRESDFLARAGGDEFVIVIPGLQSESCWSQLERFRAVAVNAGWAVCGEACLSMSMGTAFYPADADTAESLLSEADRRMYVSKRERKTSQPVVVNA